MAQTLHSLDHEAGHNADKRRRMAGQAYFLVMAPAVIGSIALATALVAIVDPTIRPQLLQEDGIVEAASVIVLLFVVTGSVYAIYHWGPRFPFVLAGLLGVAELMDETSFGSRLFGFDPPPLYGGGELDGFHDLAILVFRLLRVVSQDLAWLWVGLMLVVAVALVAYATHQIAKSVGDTAGGISSHTLILLHFGLIGFAQVIDVATHSHVLAAMEEVFELDAEILLGFYLLQQAHLASDVGNTVGDRKDNSVGAAS